MDESPDYGRYSLGIGVHEGMSSVSACVSDRQRHMWFPLGRHQPANPIPFHALGTSAPEKAVRMFLAAIRRGEFEAPLEGDRIGLCLTVDRHGANERHSQPNFFGTAVVCEDRYAIDPNLA